MRHMTEQDEKIVHMTLQGILAHKCLLICGAKLGLTSVSSTGGDGVRIGLHFSNMHPLHAQANASILYLKISAQTR